MELILCSLCGTEYDARRRFCPRCGETRSASATPSAEAAASGAARWGGRALLVVGALAIVVVAAVIALPRRTPSQATSRPAPERLDRVPVPVEAALPPMDPESVPPAERAFLDEVAVGQIAFNEGRFDDAFTEFAKAFQKDPRNAHAANAAGQTLVRLGRSGEAIPYFETATALAPDRSDFHFNMARALGQGGRWPEAAQEYRRAADIRPDYYAAIFNLGQALERSGDGVAALAQYQHGTEIAPLEPSFRLAAGALAERLGRTEDSRKAFEEYLELVPEGGESARVRERLAKLSAAAAQADSGAPATPEQQR